MEELREHRRRIRGSSNARDPRRRRTTTKARPEPPVDWEIIEELILRPTPREFQVHPEVLSWENLCGDVVSWPRIDQIIEGHDSDPDHVNITGDVAQTYRDPSPGNAARATFTHAQGPSQVNPDQVAEEHAQGPGHATVGEAADYTAPGPSPDEGAEAITIPDGLPGATARGYRQQFEPTEFEKEVLRWEEPPLPALFGALDTLNLLERIDGLDIAPEDAGLPAVSNFDAILGPVDIAPENAGLPAVSNFDAILGPEDIAPEDAGLPAVSNFDAILGPEDIAPEDAGLPAVSNFDAILRPEDIAPEDAGLPAVSNFDAILRPEDIAPEDAGLPAVSNFDAILRPEDIAPEDAGLPAVSNFDAILRPEDIATEDAELPAVRDLDAILHIDGGRPEIPETSTPNPAVRWVTGEADWRVRTPDGRLPDTLKARLLAQLVNPRRKDVRFLAEADNTFFQVHISKTSKVTIRSRAPRSKERV
ncbi:uncharacterized protein [Drosophila pseudoobscura]|uniref:Uncharacterized protein n=1 Tax=Drosophila pseudoobscura pseudoobscura TaxID=46245 RepID=A0A6I8WDS3_DROPS|nr:uncharacterized protein LOC117185438 [Drosophila pseudoobscura]